MSAFSGDMPDCCADRSYTYALSQNLTMLGLSWAYRCPSVGGDGNCALCPDGVCDRMVEVLCTLVDDEITNDPLVLGYAGKTDAEQAALMMATSEVDSSTLPCRWHDLSVLYTFAPNEINEAMVTEAKV